MQSELEELKREVGELKNFVKENNDLLRKMRRSQKWRAVFTAIYWLIIIGSAGAAYLFIQPYLENLLSVYGQILGG